MLDETAGDEEALHDARAFGLDETEVLDALAHARALDGHEGVWRDNAPAVEAFLVVSSQWRVVTLQGRDGARCHVVGLDYAGVKCGLDAAGIALTPELFFGLRIMEDEARAVLNEEH